MRKVELRSDDMKIAKKNVADIWEDMKPDEKSSDVKGRAQVMFLDSNTATASPKARTHWPGWRTAHASSLVVVLGSDA